MYEGITFEDFLKVGAGGGETEGPWAWGYQDTMRTLWKCGQIASACQGCSIRKASETTLTDLLGFVERVVWLCGP